MLDSIISNVNRYFTEFPGLTIIFTLCILSDTAIFIFEELIVKVKDYSSGIVVALHNVLTELSGLSDAL